jgi:hypothetical protein
MQKTSNYSLSGRFCARMEVVLYSKLVQFTQRPDGYLNSYKDVRISARI